MTHKKKKNTVKKIQNRRALFDYELGDNLITGIQLTGAEVKNLRMGHGQLTGSYVTIKDNELWLINATIYGSAAILVEEKQQKANRKLLAKKKEILKLIEHKQKGQTIIPLEFLTIGRYIKLKIAVGRGRKNYDKRQNLKANDHNREIRRTLKNNR